MIQNPPDVADNLSLIWPEDKVYVDGAFVGYVMPKALGETDLSSLSSLNISKKLDAYWKSRFSRDTEAGIQNRVEVCKNIAEAVQTLHHTGNYVLVDIKPENIKVGLNGQISLIDLDSIEIIHNGELLFAADKLSTEYSPAEIQHLDFQKDIISTQWDSFSLAVVFYKILFGLHPFSGTPKRPYEALVTQEQKIKHALLPVGKKSRYFKIIPAPHRNFKAIPKTMQELFLRALDSKGGTSLKKRPSSREWVQGFKNFTFTRTKYQNPSVQLARQQKNREKPSAYSALEYLQNRKDKGHRILSLLSLVIMGIIIWFSITFDKYIFPKEPSPLDHLTLNMPYDFVGEGPYLAIKNNQFGYINRAKELVIDYQFDHAEAFSEGLALVEKNEQQGYINALGREVVPLVYDKVYAFQNGLARVRLENKEGFVNRQGEKQIPLIYDKVGSFSSGRAGVVLNKMLGVIDLQGNVIVPMDYKVIIQQENGLYQVTKGDKIGFLDRDGYPIAPMIYSRARNYTEGLVAVFFPQKGWGYLNTRGEVAISFGYIDAHAFSEGLAKVETLHGCGFINKKGVNVIPWQYENVESFSEGFAAVKTGNRWGFIDRHGKITIPPKFDKVFDGGFQHGVAKVLLAGEVVFINYQGNLVDQR